MHTNEPDYSKYTLEELYDVAQHIDRVRYAERYNRVLEEFEKRSGQAMPPKPPRRTAREWLTKNLWEHGDAQRDFAAIIAWWEERRRFYNLFFFAVVGSSVLTVFAFGLLFALRDGSLMGMMSAPSWFITNLLGSAFMSMILCGFLYICINLIYVFFLAHRRRAFRSFALFRLAFKRRFIRDCVVGHAVDFGDSRSAGFCRYVVIVSGAK